MSFHLYSSDIDALSSFIVTTSTDLTERTRLVSEAVKNITELQSFQGPGAEATKSYFQEVHLTLTAALYALYTNIKNHYLIYANTFFQNVDPAHDGHFDERALVETADTMLTLREGAQDLMRRTTASFDNISDIMGMECGLRDATYFFNECINAADNLRTDFQEHENRESVLLSELETQLEEIRSLLASLKGANTPKMDSYLPGTLFTHPGIENVYTSIFATLDFSETHADTLASSLESLIAREELRYEDYLAELARQREEAGWWQVGLNAVLLTVELVVGIAAVVSTGGLATPAVVAFFSATMPFLASNIVEGAQHVYYGSEGDAESLAFNPLRDTLFFGSQELYDMTELVVTTTASLAFPVSLASLGSRATTSGLKVLLREGAEEVLSEGIAALVNPLASGVFGEGHLANAVSGLAGMASGAGGRGSSRVPGTSSHVPDGSDAVRIPSAQGGVDTPHLNVPEVVRTQDPELTSHLPDATPAHTPEAVHAPDTTPAHAPEAAHTPETVHTPEQPHAEGNSQVRVPEGEVQRVPDEGVHRIPDDTTAHVPEGGTQHTPDNTTVHAPEGGTQHTPDNTTVHAPEGNAQHTPDSAGNSHAPESENSTPYKTETFSSWQDMKDAHPRRITAFLREHKPLGSPVPKSWFDEGGTLEITYHSETEMTWTYTINGVSADFVPVTLPNGNPGHEIRFPVEYVNMDVGEIDIGRFTGDRNADIAAAERWLADAGFNPKETRGRYAIHHCMESGKMILVDIDIHNRFRHYGGHYHNKNL